TIPAHTPARPGPRPAQFPPAGHPHRHHSEEDPHMRKLLPLLLGLVIALSSCTTIPVAGPVEPVPVSAPPRGIELAPEPPQPGIQPARLIDGFLQAMADPEADYEVARQYLSSSAEENWDPLAGTQVYDGTVEDDEGRHS